MAATIAKDSVVETKCENVEDDAHAARVLKRVDSLRCNDQLSDVVLISGNDDKRISAHRLILAGSSEYFSAMFTGSLRESREREVILNDISGDILEILVCYCYTGSLELRIETVDEIIKNADKMQLHSAVDICNKFIIRNLHPENCIEIMLFALKMNFSTLYDGVFEFICRNFMEVSNTMEYLMLEAEILVKIINSNDLNTPSEEYVFDCLKKWIEYHPETRRELTNQLLASIRMTQLSPEFIIDNIEPICESINGKKLIIEALTHHFLPEKDCSFAIRNFRVRSRYHRLLAIYNEKESLKVAEFNRTKLKWAQSYSKPSDTLAGAAAMNDQIIFGSVTRKYSTISHGVFSYDFTTKLPKNLKSMTSSRSNYAMIAHNDSVYVIGGVTGDNHCVSTVEKLNLESDLWVSCPSMHISRSYAGIGVIGSQLYIVGGKGHCGTLPSVECFSTNTNKWEAIAPMNAPRCGPGVVALNGLLYVFGGCADGKFFERYDPSTNKWTMCPSKMVCSGETSCAAIGNIIYIYSNSTVKEYYVVNNTWKSVGSPITNTSEATSIILLPISSNSNHRNCI